VRERGALQGSAEVNPLMLPFATPLSKSAGSVQMALPGFKSVKASMSTEAHEDDTSFPAPVVNLVNVPLSSPE
jgi:hypothetical protein